MAEPVNKRSSEPAEGRETWDPTTHPEHSRREDKRGLECRKCGCRHFFVDNTPRAGKMIIHYRRCRNCGQPMTTCERALGQSG